MYRIFCESYQNYIKSFTDDNYRLKISEPLELIVNTHKFNYEKKQCSDMYKKLCDLIYYIKENIKRFPNMKAFLWTLESRKIIPTKPGARVKRGEPLAFSSVSRYNKIRMKIICRREKE